MSIKSGLFNGMEIDTSCLTTTSALPGDTDSHSVIVGGKDWDTRSAITSKSFRGLNMTKKDKHKVRHDTWIHSRFTFTILPFDCRG